MSKIFNRNESKDLFVAECGHLPEIDIVVPPYYRINICVSCAQNLIQKLQQEVTKVGQTQT